MANDARAIKVFDSYYYGADRWGAWPLLIARLINHSTGFLWTNDHLHAARATWLFIGVLALALLNRRTAAPVIVAGLLGILGLWIVRLRLFDLSQLYAWQIPCLLIAWLATRQWFDNSHTFNQEKRSTLTRVAWAFVFLFFSLLAVWSSPVSGPFLGALVIVETCRALVVKPAGASYRPPVFTGVAAVAIVFFAMGAEVLWRWNYHRYSLKHFGENYKTKFGLDFGYLGTNLKTQLNVMMPFEWNLLIVIACIAVVLTGAAALYFWWQNKRDGLRMVRQLLLDDTSFTILGALALAAINFALMTVVDHVRISLYDNRYLTITFVFGSVAGLLVVWRVVKFLIEKTRARSYAQFIFVLSGLLSLLILFPGKKAGDVYNLRKETAQALARKSPNAVLMGGYWETYVFSGLQLPRPLMPLPIEGHLVRMPWARSALKNSSDVVVEYKHTSAGKQVPAEHMIQYGVRLRLVDQAWYENSDYAFARYVRE